MRECQRKRSFGPHTMPFFPIFVNVFRTEPQLTERQEEASVLGHGQGFGLNRLNWFYSYRETDFSSNKATLSRLSINQSRV